MSSNSAAAVHMGAQSSLRPVLVEAWLKRAVRRRPRRAAINAMTYAELDTRASGVALGVDPGERWLSALPLNHVGGLSIVVRSAIYATTALVHERWDTERVARALRTDGVTLISL